MCPTNEWRGQEDLVRLYLNDIGRHSLLTKDDEARLAQNIEAGRDACRELTGIMGVSPSRQRQLRRLIRDGDEATETFVKANLRLVVSIAKRYQSTELPLLDLVQDGNLGLSTRWRNSTGTRASSSRRTPPGGSVRPSPGASPTPPGPCASRCTPENCSNGDQGPQPPRGRARPPPHYRGARRRPVCGSNRGSPTSSRPRLRAHVAVGIAGRQRQHRAR